MKRLEWRIAARYLRSRRSSRLVSLITLIATAGVAVGVTALIVVMGVMNGLQSELREKILIASPHLRILTFGRGLRVDNWREALEMVRAHPDVEAAAPFVITPGMVRAGADYTEGVRVLGIDPDTATMSVTPLPRHFSSGDLRFATQLANVDGGIILGGRVSDRLLALEGDSVSVISAARSRFNAAIGAFMPSYWWFEVTGRFETGMYEYDNTYVVMRLDVAQRFAGLGDAVSGIDVRVTDPNEAPRIGAELEALLDYPYFSKTWQEQNAQLFSALQLEKLGMGLILLLIVIVAAFNIVGTLTMVVTDKTREIGILRAMGLSAKSVYKVFVLQGIIVGLVGTVTGAIAGIAVAQLFDRGRFISLDPSVYFIDHLPIKVQPFDSMLIIFASIVVATVATLYPSRRAAELAPVEA
ncbi:MAG: FtsX-like permease family protein, partial [Gammaproteobacteria bacterium]